jgi:demethylmenaquinone methyltransferase/2-methoxy-6-polyprenyl-1,4-benzoquinol methylase
MALVSVLVASVPLLLVFYTGIGKPSYSDGITSWILVRIPLMISCVCALFASRRVVDEYAAQMHVAPGSLPYNLDTVDIYDLTFQQMLFDRLQHSYTTVASIASFGLLGRWRRQLVALIDLQPDARVCDLMSGAGALWRELLPRLGPQGRLIGIEHSPTTVQVGQTKRQAPADPRVELRLGNALSTALPDSSVSVVTCAFGPMLFNPAQVSILADEIARILDDHGVVALVDMRLPESGLLRKPYLFYLRRIVPLVALILGGDPSLYSTLARFVEQSSATQQLEFLLAQRGFQLFHYRFSGGLATALVGMKIWKSHNL